MVTGGGRGAAVLAGRGSRADRRRPRRRGLARGRRRGRPGRGGRPGGRGRHPGLGHRPRQPAADSHDLAGRADLGPGRGRRAAGGTGPHTGRGRGGAARLRRGRYARRSRPADGCAVVVGGPHHLGAAGMVDRIRAQRRPVRAAGGDGWHQRFRRRGRRRRAPGRLALPGRPGVAVAVAGTARRRAQRGAPARGHPGKPYHRPWHAGAAIRAGAVRRRLGQWRQDLAGDPVSRCRPAGRRDGPGRGRRGFPRHRHAGRWRGPGRDHLVVA